MLTSERDKGIFSGQQIFEDLNISRQRQRQNFLDCSKFWAYVGKFLAFVWKIFIVDEDNIIYLSNNTNTFELPNISVVCFEISSMCPEIRIVHQIMLFLTYDANISRWLKVSCVCLEIYSMSLKIFRLVKIYIVCPEIFSMCPKTLIIQKYYICFLSYDTT